MTNRELIDILNQLDPELEVMIDFTKPGATMLSLFPLNVVQVAVVENEVEEELLILSFEADELGFGLN
jgi:hypothetical protein